MYLLPSTYIRHHKDHYQYRRPARWPHLFLICAVLFALSVLFLTTSKDVCVFCLQKSSTEDATPQVVPEGHAVDEEKVFNVTLVESFKTIASTPLLQKTLSKLQKRGVTLSWEDALGKGNKLLTAMEGQRTQTSWITIAQLTGPSDATPGMGSGWKLDTMAGTVYSPLGYKKAYADLQIQSKNDERWFMNQYSSFANTRFQDLEATYAEFVNVFNVEGRTIIAAHNTSPRAAIDKEEIVKINEEVIPWQQRLPNVQKWSDVVGITWANKAGDQAHKLKYIFRQAILTPTTVNIINIVVEGHRVDSPSYQQGLRWPGIKFSPKDDEFKAFLGTPHGSAVAYLLLEHPKELPNKQIEAVQIFLTEEDGKYHMLWTLND